MNKTLLKILFLLGVLLLGGTQTLGVDLSKDGHALFCIAIPEQMTVLEQMAKDDLKDILGKISGAEFKVVPEQFAEGPAIYVGNTKYAAEQGVKRDSLKDEEWIIRTAGDNLILIGGGLAGSYYAVQALLRKAGYYMLTLDQEVIPSKPTLTIEKPDEQRLPSFAGRCIYSGFIESAFWEGISYEQARAFNLWLLRNLLNGPGENASRIRPYYIGKAFNILQFPVFHSLMTYVPPEKYFDTHPEYYAMNEAGQRVKPKSIGIGSCLCMSNPEVVKVVIQNMLAMMREDRELLPPEHCPSIYDLSLLDDFGYICRCPNCQETINRHGGEKQGGNTSLMLLFSNQVAEAVAKEVPEMNLRVFAYSCCRDPSKTVKPAANILVQYCDLFSQGDAYRPLTSPFNRMPYDKFMGWVKTGAPLMVWDYWNLTSGVHRPETVLDTIQPDFRLFRENGVQSLFIETDLDRLCPQTFFDLQLFIGAQLMIDSEQDVEELVRIFLDGYYGSAAPVMREYLQALREGVKNHPSLQISIRIERWRYLTSEFAVRWYGRLTAAEQALPEGSPYRIRVQGDKLSLMWAVCASAPSYRQAFEDVGVTMDSLDKECFELSKRYLHRFGFRNTKRRFDAKLEEEWEKVSVRIPVPELFQGGPEERLRILGYPLYRKVRSHGTDIVVDPKATCGKALKSAHPLAEHHGPGKVFVDSNEYCATAFYLANIGSSGQVELKLTSVPQDEEYHWFRIPGTFDMNSLAYFWGHGWGIQMNISHVYVLADGVSDNNRWQGWFRAKFTGPEYVPGSRQDNAIWIDLVVLSRPGEPLLEKYPKSGLVK